MRKILLVVVSVMFLISGFSFVACQKKETTEVPATTEQGEQKAPETSGYGEQNAPETGGYGEQK